MVWLYRYTAIVFVGFCTYDNITAYAKKERYMKSKLVLIMGTVGLLIAAFLIGTSLYKSKQSEHINELAQDDRALFIRPYSQSIGSPMARVTLVEFLDPECEACRLFHPEVKKILKEFEGSIRFVVRYAPFHKNSKTAVKILEAAAKQGKYWETMDIFFEKQPQWGDHHSPKPELLWTYLPELGLDVDKIKQDMKGPEMDKIIEQDVSDGVKLGVRRTPTFFVNGQPLTRFGVEELKTLIKSQL